jgi:hypothetical protein
VGDAAAEAIFPTEPTFYIQVFNGHTSPVRFYFDEDDATADENYVELVATGSVGDYFEGPAELWPYVVGNERGEKTRGPIYVKSTSGNAPVTIVFYSRR